MLGLAAGDALGTTVEFSAPGTFTPLTDMIGGGPFHLEPGQWTDDRRWLSASERGLARELSYDSSFRSRRINRIS